MRQLISLLVNGEPHEIAVEPHTTLLEVLREKLGLTGAKDACGTGECGSCTILLDGRPVVACLILAVDCQKMDITTIEGISSGDRLSSVQQSFQDTGAVQCGFCTPGMVLSSTALLAENSRPTEWEIKKALEGNLCRCTGYYKIVQAIRGAAADASKATQEVKDGQI